MIPHGVVKRAATNATIGQWPQRKFTGNNLWDKHLHITNRIAKAKTSVWRRNGYAWTWRVLTKCNRICSWLAARSHGRINGHAPCSATMKTYSKWNRAIPTHSPATHSRSVVAKRMEYVFLATFAISFSLLININISESLERHSIRLQLAPQSTHKEIVTYFVVAEKK